MDRMFSNRKIIKEGLRVTWKTSRGIHSVPVGDPFWCRIRSQWESCRARSCKSRRRRSGVIKIRVRGKQWVTGGSLKLQRRDPMQSPRKLTQSSVGTAQWITQSDAGACRGCSGCQRIVRVSQKFSLRWFRSYLPYIFPVKISFVEELIKPSSAALVFRGTIVQK